MLVQKCSYPKCGLRIAVTKVFWRSLGDKSLPYCCVQCWFQHRKEVESETQMANQNEAMQTSCEVLPADKPHVKHALGKATQATFEDLNFFW